MMEHRIRKIGAQIISLIFFVRLSKLLIKAGVGT